MDYRDGLEGTDVIGTDTNGSKIEGKILNVGRAFGVATIQTGNDRLDKSVAFLNNIEEIK